MDKESRELAISAFSMLNEQLSPVYRQARQDFLNRLAMSDVTFDTMQGRLENGTHNREAITSFCVTLPPAHLIDMGPWSSSAFLLGKDIDEVAVQHASTVWASPYKDAAAPFYVVGIDAKQNRLLLAPPVLNLTKEQIKRKTWATKVMRRVENSLIIVELEKSGHRKARKLISQVQQHVDVINKLYMPEATDYSATTFDRWTGRYAVWPETPGSIKLYKKTFTDDRYNYGKQERIAYLPDAELKAFNVMDYLSQLAMTFDRGKEFLTALGKKTTTTDRPKIDSSDEMN